MVNIDPPYMISTVEDSAYMQELVELFERTDQSNKVMYIPLLVRGRETGYKRYILINEYIDENVIAGFPRMPRFTCCGYYIKFTKDIIEEAYREFPELKDADSEGYPDPTYTSWVTALTWAALKQIQDNLPSILEEAKIEFSKQFVNSCRYDQSEKPKKGKSR